MFQCLQRFIHVGAQFHLNSASYQLSRPASGQQPEYKVVIAAVENRLALSANFNNSRLTQLSELLREGGLADFKVCSKLIDRPLSLNHSNKNTAPDRFRKVCKNLGYFSKRKAVIGQWSAPRFTGQVG